MPRRVPTHRPRGADLAGRQYETTASRKADKAFYDSAVWKRLRALVLAEEPLCRDCTAQGRATAAEHVHHVKDRKARPDLALDRDNLVGLCQRCHNAYKGNSR